MRRKRGTWGQPAPPGGGGLIKLQPALPHRLSRANRAKRAQVQRGVRLQALWLGWLLAMLFHVNLGLMPLFHGISPQIESQVAPSQLPLVFGAMLAYFLLPLAALVVIAYASSEDPDQPPRWMRPWQRFHLALSVVYTFTNVGHLMADILVPDSRPDQVALMVVMVVLGLLINREAWLWRGQRGHG